MAWNKSSSASESKRRSAAGGGRPTGAVVKGLLAAALIVVGVAGAIFLFRNANRQHTKIPKARPGKIAEVKPAAAKPTTYEKPKELPPQRVGEIRDGKMLLQSGRLHPVKGVTTGKVERAWSSIFPHPSENIIAGLLAAKPGAAFVGTPHYNGRFTQNFLKSLEEPIIVSRDDPEEIQQLKRAVIAAKIELKAAYDRGENIEEVLQESREELQRMSRYKQELKADIYQYTHKTEGITEQDVDDYIAAANTLLEAKGIAPIKKNWLTGLKLRMNQHKEDKQ